MSLVIPMLRPILVPVVGEHSKNNSSWYNLETGMIICSNRLLMCSEDVIPCL